MKVVGYIDPVLHREFRIEAMQRDVQVPQAIAEAIAEWVEKQKGKRS